ncbi:MULTISPECIES: tryptophan 7-halogenase [unclassified Sphingomonas]|uniref:tryptophan 7-halogenase n=1 Tax=unclassified Sphingomonas TaxID=196159 RepID=UPI000690BFA3|nr:MULTISPECIES: tryptophan 7-halogenase [unclassified Sphingomonas]
MAHDAGWQWRIPLRHRVADAIVSCSRHLDHDAALARLLGDVDCELRSAPNRLRFVTGTRRRPWHRNRIARALPATSWSCSNRPATAR